MALKKLNKDIVLIAKTGIGAGFMSQTLSGAGSPQGAKAVGKIAKVLPMAGNLSASGTTIGLLKKLKPKLKY